MKKITLLFASMLMGLTTVTAAEIPNSFGLTSQDLDLTSRYRYTQPISFVERGVEFLIFADGSFDFNTDVYTTSSNDNYYYKRTTSRTRRSTNRTYGAPGVNYAHDGGVLVTHDRYGRVRRIGNVFLNYDSSGRIKRAGTVYMSYRNGQLKQVGGLQILYNRHGDVIGTRGFVNQNNRGNGNSGSTTYYFENDEQDNWDDNWNNDDEYYYYRKNGKTVKQKKLKV
ncbi:hypothetical protein [Winogradskyella sp. SYSU M77433]|uniref:hypothetical protein n=1 Tax=Winogradskyella sp. SYSU M77433 TaxID=3042722 RepID=UPI00247FA9F4|nr:hypothetical protein [Winogradskyella sp. SYSU M77433]MDH7912612.1 hypothetical protein [Winogradskyella sp. SYSU M77433]